MSPVITDIQMLCYLMEEPGQPGGPDRAAIERAIAADQGVRALHDQMKRVLEMLGSAAETDRLFVVEPAKLSELAARTIPGRPQKLLARAQAVLAQLVFDSWKSETTLAGFRGGTSSRRLIYETTGQTIELQVTHEQAQVASELPGRVHVLGRVEGGACPRAVRIGSDRGPTMEVILDEAGFFEFVATPGVYDLQILGEDSDVELNAVDLGEGTA